MELMPQPGLSAALFGGAMLLGVTVAMGAPQATGLFGVAVEPVIIALVSLVFFGLKLEGAAEVLRAPRALCAALGVNFLLIPFLAWGLTALTVPSDEALRLGVLIYLLFPCTDWFLGFIRVAGGNLVLGAALIPVNLVLQLLLYPVWVAIFTGRQLGSVLEALGPVLVMGVVLPAVLAGGARLLLMVCSGRAVREEVILGSGSAVPWLIALMIFCLFAANGAGYAASPEMFAQVLLTVFLFFVVICLLIEAAAALLRLSYEDHVLLSFTASARNAPLMLAVTSLVFGDVPVLMAAIVLGMLLEFPHLTVLTWVMRRRRQVAGPPG